MKKPKIETRKSLKQRTIEVGTCWEWQGYYANGTPYVSHKGKMSSVRRVLMEVSNKPVKRGFYVPQCGNSKCVNPDHIIFHDIKTHMTKSASKSAKNITRRVKIQNSKRALFGKLTQEIADEIRLSQDAAPAMAEKYGVNKSVIYRIRAGKAWVNLSNPFASLF